MTEFSKKRISELMNFRVDWRLAWYSVVLWLLAIVVGGFVILPWFYLALPIVVFWLTTVYFKGAQVTLAMGLSASLFWFLVVAVLDFLEIIGPNFANTSIYFADFRNWLKYPLILLIPVIYSMIGESRLLKQPKKPLNLPRQLNPNF